MLATWLQRPWKKPKSPSDLKLTLFGARALVFYVVMVGAFFGAPYVNLFFLLIGFLSVQWVVALWWTWSNGSGLRAEFEAIAPVPAGKQVALQAELFALKRTRYGLQAQLELPDGELARGEVSVLKGNAQLVLHSSPLPRGIHLLQGASVTSTYPFGLLRRKVSLPAPGELVVYPAPSEERVSGRSAEDLFLEMLGTGFAGEGELQPCGLRDHRVGDDLRDVHWRASARRGKWVIQEWDGGSDQGMEVVLDRRCSLEDLEDGLAELSTLVHLARECKQVLAIRSQGHNETYGEGHQDWAQALRFLAGADALPMDADAPPPTASEVLRLPRGGVHVQA